MYFIFRHYHSKNTAIHGICDGALQVYSLTISYPLHHNDRQSLSYRSLVHETFYFVNLSHVQFDDPNNFVIRCNLGVSFLISLNSSPPAVKNVLGLVFL